MPNQGLTGILIIHKPSGWTSHDVVARVRNIVGQRKVGHAGTLDPLATGVLVVCLGQATRVAEYLMNHDKVYQARIRLGIATDTYDAEGQVTRQAEVVDITRDQVERELGNMVGLIDQTPPMYSAIKHRGTPLYRLARSGQEVARKPRKVDIKQILVLDWALPDVVLRIHCSKGTYVRALAHDLGERLGCGAHLADLLRTASGRFTLTDAVSLQELEEAFSQGRGSDLIQPIDTAVDAFPAVAVDPETARRITFGQRVRLLEPLEAELCRAYAGDGRLVALLRNLGDGIWRPHKVFVQYDKHDQDYSGSASSTNRA
jgi:tRNA pseudouridine55 synthase